MTLENLKAMKAENRILLGLAAGVVAFFAWVAITAPSQEELDQHNRSVDCIRQYMGSLPDYELGRLFTDTDLTNRRTQEAVERCR